ncbi:MAG: ATP synthase subunit C [Waddliaceae bacterium]|jgi:V/A-type H+/Na+-transporting ATPase subunit K|nr:ATP synthase subunit C [Waddliaceae bacterium]MBT3579066.1 ATP synthase subunit C [Waddliaceae bacterium]MBT4444776.1 ATP synthase subunit C [Waddliaceae bacterium]MBT6928045.1 ATP synthase subunit C [Waddliaceae bacterium]MBT7264429.1 ATP synthase subunit C [Waddliaceae bacterium]
MDFSMIGPALALGLSCLGSAVGCGIAGMASHGVMSRVEEGHGKFIGMSATPSSQSIYGFILMILLSKSIVSGSLSPLSGIGIGLASGVAIMVSAIFQGKCAASAIQASAKQPAIFGKCFVAIGVVESFALFAFVFALLIMG